ncbi:MAG: ribosomal-processing cysteine protease Prp [Thomasclavelia sp.]|jgi:uncharacterized protein YsxB (DUF464 family)|nr:ribosomal-processing cysteine protease Prp [Thomasclavelia sp.]
MIKIIEIKKDNLITEFEISGHAGSGEYGQDIVCAGVSAVIVGVCNTIDQKGYSANCDIQIKSGYTKILVKKSNNDIQVILETLEYTLKGFLNEQYSDFVKYTLKEE